MNNEPHGQFDDDEWSSLVDDWQNQPTREIDTRDYSKKIKRRSRYIWVVSILDVVTVALAGVMTLWLAIMEPEKIVWTLLFGLSTAWGIVVVYFEFKLRRGTWRLKDDGSYSVLEFSIRRCQAAIRIGKLFAPAMVSYCVLLVFWQYLVVLLGHELDMDVLIWAASWGVITIIASLILTRRKQKELAKLLEMRDPDEG